MDPSGKNRHIWYRSERHLRKFAFTFLYCGRDPIFTSLTAANIVEGQLDGKDLNVPVHYYAIQELNTGEGTTIPQKAASAWKKYELQNQGQAGQITTPQSDESGNNEVTTVDGNGNAASDENKVNTSDDVQVEPEQDGNNTLS